MEKFIRGCDHPIRIGDVFTFHEKVDAKWQHAKVTHIGDGCVWVGAQGFRGTVFTTDWVKTITRKGQANPFFIKEN